MASASTTSAEVMKRADTKPCRVSAPPLRKCNRPRSVWQSAKWWPSSDCSRPDASAPEPSQEVGQQGGRGLLSGMQTFPVDSPWVTAAGLGCMPAEGVGLCAAEHTRRCCGSAMLAGTQRQPFTSQAAVTIATFLYTASYEWHFCRFSLFAVCTLAHSHQRPTHPTVGSVIHTTSTARRPPTPLQSTPA